MSREYKFYKYENNPNGSDYCFCQRPSNNIMSLRCFCKNGEILGFMSEAVVYKYNNIKEVDMIDFMYNFVRPIIKENQKYKEVIGNIDEYLYEAWENGYDKGEYDLEKANVGVLLYFLEDVKQVNTKSNKNHEYLAKLEETINYYEQKCQSLKEKNEALDKGLRKVVLKRKKWKTRYDKEKQKNKQLGNCYCNRTDCSSRINDNCKYDSLVQKKEKEQQKFIKYLKNKIEHQNIEQETEYGHARDIGYYFALTDILEKYKEITQK